LELEVKILCLSTYPIDEPRHGGQHRLSNIVGMLRERGHEVCSAGVLGSAAYPDSRYFVPYPGTEALHGVFEHYSFMEDWIISELFGKEGKYFSSLSDKIPMRPDAIYVEQPWMFSFAELFNKRTCNGKAILYYGSANIEHRLKADILSNYYSDKHVADCSEKVLACEVNAIRRAAQTYCVSEGDLGWSREFSEQPPILAPNGVIDRRASMADIQVANQITQGKKFALYCASAHTPNMEGFFDMFGEGAGCFPPEARMVVAGGAGRSIADDPRLHRTGSLIRQYIDAGQVPEDALRGLLATAHQIILPITAGGGTNLKTAEAIWSGQHIVATPKAMRGFEEFSSAQGVSVASDSSAFCGAVRRTFMLPNLALSVEERISRRVVLWENTLASLIDTISNAELVA
jgi:hypothetical protein